MIGASSSPKTTPPGSLIKLPPSPPSTGSLHATSRRRRATALLRALKVKSVEGGIIEVAPGDFAALVKQLRESDLETLGWLEDKARYAGTLLLSIVADKLRLDRIRDEYLCLRMPTPIHEYLGQKLGDALKEGLQSMKGTCNFITKRLIDDTLSLGSADVRFTKTWHRSPDQQFKIKTLHFPGIILEIACSQPESSLARAAKDYIIESYGRVQKVVGIKVDHESSCVSLTVWAPIFEMDGDVTVVGYTKLENGNQVRDAQGNALRGSLELQLGDLGPQTDLDRLYPGAELGRTIEITYGDIVRYIREAESVQEAAKDIPAPPANTKKRPRSESSIEGLDSEDEREYKRREKKDDDNSMASDDDYRP